jgi:hypothetical protein
MKKFLAIALVLAMATVANAGVALVRSDGLTTIGPNETITVQLKGTDSSGFGIGALDDGAALGSVSSLAFGSGLTPVDEGFIENMESPSAGIYGCLLDYASAYVTNNNVTGVMFSFVYVAPAVIPVGGITIAPVPYNELYRASDGADYNAPLTYIYIGGQLNDIDPLVLTPEPMTLGLLGLGGLFLRRRLA